jgi:hypothetical protein
MRLSEGDSSPLPPSFLPSTLFLQVAPQLVRAWPLVSVCRSRSSAGCRRFISRESFRSIERVIESRETVTCLAVYLPPPLNPYPFPLPLPPVSIRVAASESVRSIAEMTRSEPEAALHGNRCVQGHDSRTFLAIFPRSGRPVHASIYPLLHRSLAGTGPEIHDKAASTHSRGYARDREERACG